MDLSKSNDPRRILKWNGKSIGSCSRADLVNCVIYLSGQIVQAGKRLEEEKSKSNNLPPELLQMIQERQSNIADEKQSFDLKMMFPVMCIVCGVVEYQEGISYSFVTDTRTGGTYCQHHPESEVIAAAMRLGTGTLGAAGYNADDEKKGIET